MMQMSFIGSDWLEIVFENRIAVESNVNFEGGSGGIHED
jgi:hypothetical protein